MNEGSPEVFVLMIIDPPHRGHYFRDVLLHCNCCARRSLIETLVYASNIISAVLSSVYSTPFVNQQIKYKNMEVC